MTIVDGDGIFVEGWSTKAVFVKRRIDHHRTSIRKLLLELPKQVPPGRWWRLVISDF